MRDDEHSVDISNVMQMTASLTSRHAATDPMITVCGVVLLGTAVVLFVGYNLIGGRGPFYLYAALLSTYLFFECRFHLRKQMSYGALAPPLIATLYYFFLSHVLSAGVSMIDPYIYERLSNVVPDVWSKCSEFIPLAALAAFAMWRGFDLAATQGNLLRRSLQKAHMVRTEWNPNFPAALVLQICSIAVVIYGIANGIFGMAGSVEAREQHVMILQFFGIAVSSGGLSLLLMLVELFDGLKRGRPVQLVMIAGLSAFVIQLGIGLLSGFKFQVVFPFLVAGLAYFLVYRRIAWTLAGMAGVALVVSYSVIEPYRAYLNRQQLYGQGVDTLLHAIVDGTRQRDDLVSANVPLSTQIASRLDMTAMSIAGVDFADQEGVDSEMKGAMVNSILLAPVYAFVPRAVWKDKPSFSTGVWYNQNVFGNTSDSGTSVGMGPITYFYMIGGGWGVGIGFLILGYLQGFVFYGIARSGAGGMLVYIGSAMTLATLPSDVGPALAGAIQLLPIMFVAQYILLRPVVRKG